LSLEDCCGDRHDCYVPSAQIEHWASVLAQPGLLLLVEPIAPGVVAARAEDLDVASSPRLSAIKAMIISVSATSSA
jgi:hypothetical protein